MSDTLGELCRRLTQIPVLSLKLGESAFLKKYAFSFFLDYLPVMEHLRQIVKEELSKLFMKESYEGEELSFPWQNDPKKAIEYAMHWQKKALEMNRFYWKIHDIILSDNSSDEKIKLIEELMPNYGWL